MWNMVFAMLYFAVAVWWLVAVYNHIVPFHKCSMFYISFLCELFVCTGGQCRYFCCCCCHHCRCRCRSLIFKRFVPNEKRNEWDSVMCLQLERKSTLKKQIIQWAIYSWYRSRVLLGWVSSRITKQNQTKSEWGSNLVYVFFYVCIPWHWCVWESQSCDIFSFWEYTILPLNRVK